MTNKTIERLKTEGHDERVVRREFESHYKSFNCLDRKNNGDYNDWNLELAWRCWSVSWACAELHCTKKAKKVVVDSEYAGFIHAPYCPCDECAKL